MLGRLRRVWRSGFYRSILRSFSTFMRTGSDIIILLNLSGSETFNLQTPFLMKCIDFLTYFVA